MFVIFWDFLIVERIFLSPQKKRSMIISNKHGIHELLHEFINKLRLIMLGNLEILGKSQNFKELLPSAYFFSSNKNLVNTSEKISWKTETKLFR